MAALPFDSRVVARLEGGSASAADLMHALGVSQSTTSRALRALARRQRVLRLGSTRGARYALKRPIARIGSQWPIYRVDEEGTPHPLAMLHATWRNSYHVPTGAARMRGLFEGIPYYLQDARPSGFLGRTVPGLFPELDLPSRVADWTDDHVLTWLVQRGADISGNLIIGEEALNRHLAGIQPQPLVPVEQRTALYPAFATAAMAGKPPGSSAQGEHPKFTACIADGDRLTHVIVKFSPPSSTPVGRRWADLLIAEHVAHCILNEHGLATCHSSLFEYGGRMFLECERFDRIDAGGRRGVVTLFAVDATRYGNLDNWTASAARLAADSLLSAGDAERIRYLDAFGALIANSDRHFGNVMLFDRCEDAFELAPVYDMLPMRFAPQNDQLIPRTFESVPARAEWLSIWPSARSAAESFWARLADDPRLSADFRAISADSLMVLRRMGRRYPP